MFLLIISKPLKESLKPQITVSFPIWSFRILTNFHIFGHHLICQGQEKLFKLSQPLFQQSQYFSTFLRKVCPTLLFPNFSHQFFQQLIIHITINRLMLSLNFLWDKSLLFYVTHVWWFHTWTILRSGFL